MKKLKFFATFWFFLCYFFAKHINIIKQTECEIFSEKKTFAKKFLRFFSFDWNSNMKVIIYNFKTEKIEILLKYPQRVQNNFEGGGEGERERRRRVTWNGGRGFIRWLHSLLTWDSFKLFPLLISSPVLSVSSWNQVIYFNLN